MTDIALIAALCAWLAWIAAHLALMITARSGHPTFNGFRINIPTGLAAALTQAELEAVIAHEIGHKRLGHVWKNFALVCFFSRPSEDRLMLQELEADDFATSLLRGDVLASALRKISSHPFDRWRASRLEMRQALKDLPTGPQEAGAPTPGTGVQQNIREG